MILVTPGVSELVSLGVMEAPDQWHLWFWNDDGGADKKRSMPRFVVSTTLDEAAWNNSTLIEENIAEEVSKPPRPGSSLRSE